MNTRLTGLVLVLAALAASAACHSTLEGVKDDTHRNLKKAGQEIEKAGDRIEGHESTDGG